MEKEYNYKIKQLCIMLEAESNSPGKYGAHLTHWSGKAKPINLDAEAIRVLIEHYQARQD